MSGSDREQAREQAHDHVFGHDRPTAGERRTLLVVLITAVTMVVEIAGGVLYGSMALLADGLHMGSHTVALGIALFAYRFARRHAADADYSFGTGKVNSLAGYSGAILLGLFAVAMAVESVERLLHPVAIAFDQALPVALLGLAVNGLSLFCLGFGREPACGQGESLAHHHRHDHNLRSAYLHVLADALTSLLAIGALLAAKFLGWRWVDPAVGVAAEHIVPHA